MDTITQNNNIQLFNNEKFGEIRCIVKDKEPWFVANDICIALHIKNNRDAISRLDDDEKDVGLIDTLGGEQNCTIINEAGLYSLVLSSRKPEAKEFKRWVTHDILPTIRKHGIYATDDTLDKIVNNPDFGIRLLTELKTEREKSKQLQSQIEKDKPKVLFAESVESSVNSVLVSDLATILKQNNINTGQNRLFKWLRDNGYLIKGGTSKNLPTQYSLNLGLFEVREKTVTDRYGNYRTVFTSMVTGKGQTYFVKKFLKEKQENKVSLSEPAVICI